MFCFPNNRTETVVEKLLTNWMSICLYTFLRVSQLHGQCSVRATRLITSDT